MVAVKRVVLDVLKPHLPGAIDFCRAIAEVDDGYRVSLTVLEMDENTQTLSLEIEASSIDFAAIQSVITGLGGSLHSIDQVEVRNESGLDGMS